MTDTLQYQLRLPGLYDTASYEQQVEICSLHNKAANQMDRLEGQIERLREALAAIRDCEYGTKFEEVPGIAYRNVAMKALAEPSLNTTGETHD